MNRQRFTTSLRINLSQISLFLFRHYFLFGPGATRTQYLASDALLPSAFPQSLYHWHTHTHNTHSRSPPPATLSSAIALAGPRTTHTGARRRQSPHSPFAPSLYRWTTHKVFVSRNHSCAEKLQVSGFAGSSAAMGSPNCYTAPSSRLLAPSSPQVWRQSVQMHDHHLCPGMPLNPVYNVIDPGDNVIGTLPASLQLG